MIVLVVAEADGAALRSISFEMVSAGREIAGESGAVITLVAGAGIDDAAAALFAAGSDRVLTVNDLRLEQAASEAMARVVAAAIEQENPAIVLAPGTTLGRDYAPRIAARFGAGLIADCGALALQDGRLIGTRPVLGGRVLSNVTVTGGPLQMATVQPGAFPAGAASRPLGNLEQLQVTFLEDDFRVAVMAMSDAAGKVSGLDTAERVVAGGRGLKDAAGFALVEQLAAALGAAVGATRPVVDVGWRPHNEQIGQTGRSVSPKLYIAVGISGAVQHIVGMQASEYIVAINRDPDAPIFKKADFGIVGDLFEVVPAIVQELNVN